MATWPAWKSDGIGYWEQFYGARPWLLPGFIAGLLTGFAAIGWDQPAWYIPAVKLAFCLISLGIPAGMYFFARRSFGEASARVALLAGAFWWELAGFAHKPMPSFVATALLLPLLALVVKGEAWHRRTLWLAALLAVLAAASRAQYAPASLAMLGWLCLRLGSAPCKPAWARTHLLLAATLLCLGVGLLDAAAGAAERLDSRQPRLRQAARELAGSTKVSTRRTGCPRSASMSDDRHRSDRPGTRNAGCGTRKDQAFFN